MTLAILPWSLSCFRLAFATLHLSLSFGLKPKTDKGRMLLLHLFFFKSNHQIAWYLIGLLPRKKLRWIIKIFFRQGWVKK
jgi:hypothetical protein